MQKKIIFLTLSVIFCLLLLPELGLAEVQLQNTRTFKKTFSDFNGDGKEDIVSFLRKGSLSPVYVEFSTGFAFSNRMTWNSRFCFRNEIPLTGDFNGDGYDDVITFSRKTSYSAAVVALSNGSNGFTNTRAWHNDFLRPGDMVVVGDFNGDGKDDIVRFPRLSANSPVYVAFSNGSSFGSSFLWHGNFCLTDEIPFVGDFNGDGKDDMATYKAQLFNSAIYVGLSNGNGFSTISYISQSTDWPPSVIPLAGDFNGDGKDDLAYFMNQLNDSSVYVRLSVGWGNFDGETLWIENFCNTGDVPLVGDYNGDGKDDIASFRKRDTSSPVYVALSNGYGFGAQQQWDNDFCGRGEIPPLIGFDIWDDDGNLYKTVKIGTQTWLTGNWMSTKYNDGTVIGAGEVKDDQTWGKLTQPAYCYYNNDNAKKPYGVMYNWFARSQTKLVPAGWRVATNADWSLLKTCLDNYKMKLPHSTASTLSAKSGWLPTTAQGYQTGVGTPGWNESINNRSGFSALPGGLRQVVKKSNGSILVGCNFFGTGEYWWGTIQDAEYTTWYLANDDFPQSGATSLRHWSFKINPAPGDALTPQTGMYLRLIKAQ